jgi:hypothetical protein
MTVSKFQELEKDYDNSESIALNLIKGKVSLSDIFEGLSSRASRVKYKSIKVLRSVSRKKPEMLYPNFGHFVKLMGNENNIFKWNSIDIIANLSSVDSNCLFEEIFDKFYDQLKEGNLITSAHVIESSLNVIKSKPELKGKILEIILSQKNLPLPTEECRSILAGKTIKVLSDCYDLVDNKTEIVDFVTSQLQSQRPATRKKAEAFLKKHSG